jgi:hypothetical protein
VHCATIVTSRSASLALLDARCHRLGMLDRESGLALLSQVAGGHRVRQEDAAAAELVELCGGLPLALRAVGAKLAVRRQWRLAHLARLLRDERRRLDEMEINGMGGVRPSIARSILALEAQSRTLLLLLADLGVDAFAGWVAGPLLGADAPVHVPALEGLVDASLIEVHASHGDRTRYSLHPLIRIYASERLHAEVRADRRRQARMLLLTATLKLVRTAAAHLPCDCVSPSPPTLSRAEADRIDPLVVRDPRAWFTVERTNLVAAVHRAERMQAADLCRELATAVMVLCELPRDRGTAGSVLASATAAAQRAGAADAEADLRRMQEAVDMVGDEGPGSCCRVMAELGELGGWDLSDVESVPGAPATN